VVVLYGLLSACWAVVPALAIDKAMKFALVCLPLAWLSAVLARRPSRVIKPRVVLIGIGLAALLLTLQTFSDVVLRSVMTGPLTVPAAIKTNVPAAALAILAWLLPLIGAQLATPGRIFSGIVLVLIGVAVLAGDGTAPRLAFFVGGSLGVMAYWLPRASAGVLLVALAGVHLAAPHLLTTTLPHAISERSILHRLEVWSLTGDLIAERPLLGYGFSNSSAIPAQAGTLPLTGERRAVPMYPHNVLLQAQLELGLFGVLAFYTAVVYLLRRALACTPLVRATALGLIAAALAVWCVGYPLWRSTWLAWLWFVALCWRSLADGTMSTCDGS